MNTIVMFISLVLGLVSAILIVVFISGELVTDDFQINHDRIFLLKCDDPFNQGHKMSVCRSGAAEYMKRNFEQVEDYCRIKSTIISKSEVNNQKFVDDEILFEASSDFFNFFSYSILPGRAKALLETKNDLVISEELSRKYFGSASSVGSTIRLSVRDSLKEFNVTGVFRKPATNSRFAFDMVTYNGETENFAFVLLKKNTNTEELERLFAENKENIPNINAGTPGRYYLESLKKSYFDIDQKATLGPVRDKSDLYLASLIGSLILIVALFNYLGLVNIGLTGKTHEFRIRRFNGASNFSLLSLVIYENILIFILSSVLGLILLSLFIPFFNELTSSNIKIIHVLRIENVALIAGLYLLLMLIISGFTLHKIKKYSASGNIRSVQNISWRSYQIPLFNIVQLGITIALIISCVFIIKQINYIKVKNIGISKEVLDVKIPVEYTAKVTVLKDEIKKDPLIKTVSVTESSPLKKGWSVLLQYNFEGKEKEYTPLIFKGDENFVTTLGLSLLSGRDFSGNEESDKNNCIINESLANIFQGENLIGKTLPGDKSLTIIGIVKDFNYTSLNEAIGPCFITFNNKGKHILIRPSYGINSDLMTRINSIWKKFIPENPPEFESVGDQYEYFNRDNLNFAGLLISCCLVSLFLALAGIFVLSYNASRNRKKEIGLRKINGATISEIIVMLNKDIFKWLAISFILAIPFSIYSIHKWLENFAYKTNVGVFALSIIAIIILIVVVITVSLQSWTIAKENPIQSLKCE